MGLDHVRAEIGRMRVQIKRQQKDIVALEKAGIGTTAAIALLQRMHAKVEELIGERNRLMGEARAERRTYASGKPILGTPSQRRM
jgi:hypothetical protein